MTRTARPPLGQPLAGHLLLELRIPPPLEPDPLRAYEAAIPHRTDPERVPLKAPAVLRANFTFHDPGSHAAGWVPGWTHGEFDLVANAFFLRMVLADRGYLARPSDVSLVVTTKRWGQQAGVRVYLRTLIDAPKDFGTEFDVDGTPRGVINPLPWQALNDVRTVELSRIADERPWPAAGGRR